MTEARILISVLNWNNAKDTIACLLSIKKLSYKNYHVVLVDNASVDNSVERIKESFPDLDVISSKENQGYAAGHKLVYEQFKNEDYHAIWILNNDIEVYPDSLGALVKASIKYPGSILGSLTLEETGHVRFGGSYEMKEGKPDVQSGWNQFSGNEYEKVKAKIKTREISDVNGSSIFLPFKIIEKGGFIPTEFFLYGEETIYSFDLRERLGVKSYLISESLVLHKGSRSFSNERLTNIGLYYRKRNSLIFQKDYLGLDMDLLKKNTFTKKWLLSYFIKKVLYFLLRRKRCLDRFYMQQLATDHAIKNISGKTISPDKVVQQS